MSQTVSHTPPPNAIEHWARFDHLPLARLHEELLLRREQHRQWFGHPNEQAYYAALIEDLTATIARRERVGILAARDDGRYQQLRDFAHDLKAATCLHAFADGYLGISLRKIGGEWAGRCPTGHESASGLSFHISDEKAKFHCFSCKAGGDLYRLVGLVIDIPDFRGQVEYVARCLGVGAEGR